MAAIPVVSADLDGILLTNTTATAGPDTIAPAGKRILLVVHNGNASATVLTITAPGTTRYGQAEPDITSISVTAAAHAAFLLPPDLADPADGLIDVTAVPNTSVNLFAVRV